MILEKTFLKKSVAAEKNIAKEQRMMVPLENLFVPYAPFLYPLKTSENLTVF